VVTHDTWVASRASRRIWLAEGRIATPDGRAVDAALESSAQGSDDGLGDPREAQAVPETVGRLS
jgi:hypothetical protein